MFCKKCGKEIADNSKFCEYCGEKITAVQNNLNYKEVSVKQKNKTQNILLILIIVIVGCVAASIIATAVLGENSGGSYSNVSSRNAVSENIDDIKNLEEMYNQTEINQMIDETNDIMLESSYGLIEFVDLDIKGNTVSMTYKFTSDTGITKNDDIAKQICSEFESDKENILSDYLKGMSDDGYGYALLALDIKEITVEVTYQDCNGEDMWSASKTFYVKDFA